ncbi:MAG: hypothetical protein V3U20_09085, partial [Thermoplasmata archaeon]
TEASSTNNHGQAVGVSGDHSFFWALGSGIVDIGEGTAHTINNYGWVVGQKEGHGYIWTNPDNTPPGNSITVNPIDRLTGLALWSLTFDEITESGVTNVASISDGPPPPLGYMHGNPQTYYELSVLVKVLTSG